MPRQLVSAYPAALDFSGSASNVAAVPYIFPTDAFTVSFRYKAKSIGGFGPASSMFASNEGWFYMQGSLSVQRQGTNDFQIYAYLNAPNDFAGPRRLRFGNFYQPKGDGRWHTRTYVIYVEGGSAKCDEYEDAVKLGSTHLVNYTGDTSTPSGTLNVGKSQTVNFNGLMARVRVYNRRLAVAEVAQDHFGHPPYPPHANWRLSEGVGPTIADSSGNGNAGVLTGAVYSADVPMKARKTLNGNLVTNGDFEYAPPLTAIQTAANWIDGSSVGSASNNLFGWSIVAPKIGSVAANFDTTVKHSGSGSMKLSLTGTGASFGVANYFSNTGGNHLKYAFPCQPNTAYTVTYWMKTNYVSGDADDGAWLVAREQGTSGGTVTQNNGTKVKTMTDWTLYTLSFTTQPTTRMFSVDLIVKGNSGAATLIMDTWFDDIEILQTNVPTRPSIAGPYRQLVTPSVRLLS